MSRRLVIFDLDGTVIDSAQVMRRAFVTAYRSAVGEGEAPFEEFLKHMGAPLGEILTRLNLPHTMIGPFLTESRAGMGSIELIEPMQALISQLSSRGNLVAIHTGKDRVRTLEILQHFGLDAYVSEVRCGEDDIRGKPEPDGILSLMRILGVPAEHTVMVGDSHLDMGAARAADIHAVGCLWGVGDRHELAAAGACVTEGDRWRAAQLILDWAGGAETWCRSAHQTEPTVLGRHRSDAGEDRP